MAQTSMNTIYLLHSYEKMMLFISMLAALSVLGAVSSSSFNKSQKFDYFVFSQEWPTSVCKGINISRPHPHVCKFGNNVTTWSIHGLWPTRNHSMLPQFCNNQSDFNLGQLNPILGELMKYWTNLYADTKLDSLWKHEWLKHGTCAVGVSGITNEYSYFNKTLELRKRYSLSSVLEQHGIVPRDATYQYTDVLKAVGGKGLLFCYFDSTIKTQYLAQIEICFSKDLNVMNCGSHHVATQHKAYNLVKRSVTYRQDDQLNGLSEQSAHVHKATGHQARRSPCSDIEPLTYPQIHH